MKRKNAKRFLSAAAGLLLTFGLFGLPVSADEGRMTGKTIQDDVLKGGDAQEIVFKEGMDIVTTGKDGGIGIEIVSNNDPVSVTVKDGAVRVKDESASGFEATGVLVRSGPGGTVNLDLDTDVSVEAGSQDPSAAAYGVKLAAEVRNLALYYMTAENGAKLPVSEWYASQVNVKRGGEDVSEEYAGLFAFFLFDDSGKCDLYLAPLEGGVRFYSPGLPAETGNMFYGSITGTETFTEGPVSVTLYASEDDPGTEVVIDKKTDPSGSMQRALFIDPEGTPYLKETLFSGNDDTLVNAFTGEKAVLRRYENGRIDAVLSGSITAETSGDSTGLNIQAAKGAVTVELKKGTSIKSTAPVTAGILARGVTDPVRITGEDVIVQAVSPSTGRSEAMGINLATVVAGSAEVGSPAVSESSVVLTGKNRIVTNSAGKPKPGKYSAGILSSTTAMGRPGAPATGISRIYFEGTVDASGTGMVGVESLVPLAVAKTMGVSKSFVTVIGDVNLSSSDSDALYAECARVSDPSRYDMTSEIYVRGNVSVTDGVDSGAGVSALGSTVIVDGDISVSGTDDLIGVYADRNATVLVTGGITAPVTVRIPEDESEKNKNNSKVYIWKGSDTCTGKTEQIGYVIKVCEGLGAEISGGGSFISLEREGRTYYGTGASDTVTVKTARDDIIVLDAYGKEIPTEKTDGGFTFTMPADCGVTVTHEGHQCGHFDGMVWAKDYSSAYAVFSCAGCEELVTVPAEVTSEVEEGPIFSGEREIVYTATVVYEGETFTDEKTVTEQAGQPEGPEIPGIPAGNLINTKDPDWIFTSLASGRKFNPPKQGERNGNESAESRDPIPEAPAEPESPVFPFTDVEPAYADAVGYVYENGIMNGVSETLFDPRGTLTRGMVVTILYRLEGSPDAEYKGTFSDVPDGTWYADGVEWAAENGIVNGCGGGKFGPDDEVTREQLAAILYRYAQAKGVDVGIDENTNYLSYSDVFEIADYARLPMFWAVENDMILDTDGDLRHAEPALRWEVAAAIQAFCENAAK